MQYIAVFILIIVVHAQESFGGIQCYECAYGDTAQATPKCLSENLDSSLLRTCDDSRPYCVNATGIVDNVPTGVRFCAGINWLDHLGGDDLCLPTEEVPGFTIHVEGQAAELINGQICICSSDQCNGPRSKYPVSVSSATARMDFTFKTTIVFLGLALLGDLIFRVHEIS